MGFTHEYLIAAAECWAWKPEKLAERRAAWPEVLTWSWFLDPERVTQWDRKEQIEILSVAVAHAKKRRVRLWATPGEIFRKCRDWAEAANAADYDKPRLELYFRLGTMLDADDDRIAKLAVDAAKANIKQQHAARELAALEQSERDAEAEAEAEAEAIAAAEAEAEAEAEAAAAAEVEAAAAAEVEAAAAEKQRVRAELETRIAEGNFTQEDLEQLAQLS